MSWPSLLLTPSAASYGPRIDHLYNLVLWITGAVFIITELALIFFAIRYRQKKGRKAYYSHGSTKAEIIWTAIPAAILIYLGFLSQALWSELRSPKRFPPHAYPIKVVAEQWLWRITYSGADGALGTDDDVTVDNDFHIPLGRPIAFDLSSQDVIHGFYIPDLRVHQDAVPGMSVPIWVTATKKGTFDVRCAQFCGTNHYQMKGRVTVDDPADFQAWLAGAKESAF